MADPALAVEGFARDYKRILKISKPMPWHAMHFFSKSTLVKHWALIPTVAICGAAVAMCATYVGYMCIRKPDLSWTPWTYATAPPYKDIAPTEVRKMINVHNLNPDMEVEALRREISLAYRSQH